MPRVYSTMVPVQGDGTLRDDPERMREYKRKWVAKRRADWLAVNGPCVRCGSWDNLEVDHIDRTTKIHHAIWSWSQQRRDAELAKCQVLCRPCHIQKGQEAGDIPPTPQHGDRGMYRMGCRCEPCRQAKAEYRASRAHMGRSA